MADIDIEIITDIEGLDVLEEALTAGSKRAATKFLRRVEMNAAKVLVQSAKAHAPKETGRLDADIHRQVVKGDGSLTVRVGPGKEAFYGAMQEWGAPEANVPAQHWLENSARAVQDEVLAEFMGGLEDGLNDMKK